MRRYFLWVATLLIVLNTHAQVTVNPKIKKKSSSDTFINKIEITDEYTVVWMQFVSKSKEQQLQEYLDSNPKQKRELDQMNPMMRNMLMQQMLRGNNFSSTISIQPGSYLISTDGRKFKFKKATNIPVAPERKETIPNEKYFFKVYFAKLEPGIEFIDLKEGDQDERDGFSYWNFYGISINNPKTAASSQALAAIPKTENTDAVKILEINLNGRVYDAQTKETLQALINCKLAETDSLFDEVKTSKTGYYEFLLKPNKYVYTISAAGYETSYEEMDLAKITSGKNISLDLYLEPLKTVPTASPDSTTLEKVSDNTFRLNHVYFATGQSTLLENSYEELDKVVQMMQQNPDMKIRIDGHTDNIGNSKENMLLSIERAKNVRDYLITKGIASARLSFKGWGDTQPLVENQSDQGRQQNRRVEITIL